MENTYGKLKNAVFNRISPRPSWSFNDWMMDMKKSGRAAVDIHIHDADFILYLLGKPKSVTSYGLEDKINMSSISSLYEYDDIYVESKGAWYNAPIPFEMSFSAYFENTMLEFKNNCLMIYENGQKVKRADVKEAVKRASGVNINSYTGYYNEIMYFIQCIRQGKALEISTPKSSIDSLEVVLKELESAEMKEKVFI
jgi:Predicted dehydrogenases and related proteins